MHGAIVRVLWEST